MSLEKARAVLVDIFLLKRLRTMHQVFVGCEQMADYLFGIPMRCADEPEPRSGSSFRPCNEDLLYQPVKVFISEFISKQVSYRPIFAMRP